MTIENWITIASTVTQIIATIGIGYWQVKIAKQLAKPDKYDDKPKITGKRVRYSRKAFVTLVLSVIVASFNIGCYFILPVTKLTIFSICYSIASVMYGVLSYLLIEIAEHSLIASKCHMERLDKLIERPCSDNKKCPF